MRKKCVHCAESKGLARYAAETRGKGKQKKKRCSCHFPRSENYMCFPTYVCIWCVHAHVCARVCAYVGVRGCAHAHGGQEGNLRCRLQVHHQPPLRLVQSLLIRSDWDLPVPT